MEDTNIKQTEVANGANPTMLYGQYMDYLLALGKVMKNTYKSRTRNNKPFTWGELDEINNKLHSDLDMIMCGHKNVQNENKQTNTKNNMKQTIRLTESELHRIIKESVKKVLSEGEDNSSIMKLKAWANNAVRELQNGSNSCYYAYLGKSDCKTGKMYIVIGWSGGFDDNEQDNPNADGEYRICAKLAYNCDALQYDYEWDWEMPYDEETGDVDDTDSEYGDNTIEWLYDYWKENYAI